MLCHEVMTPDPACCTPEETADRAAKMMKVEDVGVIPVCGSKEGGQLVGIVTDRDLCLEIVAEKRDAGSTLVEVCMSRDPVVCRIDEELDTAVHRMEAHQIRRIPVVDSDGRLVGIISQADIARRVGSDEKTAELVEDVSRPTS